MVKKQKPILEETEEKVIRDRPIKSLVKSISWRVVGTFDTMIISYIVTGEMVLAVSIGGIEVFTKIILYYLHERAWAHMRWGRMMVVLRKNTRRSKKTFNKILFWKG